MFNRQKIYLTECHVAGRQYYDANEAWHFLRVGTYLNIERDYDNPYDPNAIALTYVDSEHEKYIIGYIPRSENKMLADFIDMGWRDCFYCSISQIKPEAHYEDQIHVTISILRNNMT